MNLQALKGRKMRGKGRLERRERESSLLVKSRERNGNP